MGISPAGDAALQISAKEIKFAKSLNLICQVSIIKTLQKLCISSEMLIIHINIREIYSFFSEFDTLASIIFQMCLYHSII